jgi:5-methylcytosine-specific restriction endonuclease McrA
VAWKACRKKRVRIATPKWLTKEQKKQMLQWYLNRPEGYHVDHIIPINNPIVCGLNVPWNFQYLTKKENEDKGNTFIA